jgi:hypothetical protein
MVKRLDGLRHSRLWEDGRFCFVDGMSQQRSKVVETPICDVYGVYSTTIPIGVIRIRGLLNLRFMFSSSLLLLHT